MVFLIFFASLVGVVSISTMLGKYVMTDSEIQRYELRKPTSLPDWGWKKRSIDHFFASADKWLTDKLSFRKKIIQLRTAMNHRLGRTLDPGFMVMGSDGWYYLGNDHAQTIDQYRGLKPMTALQKQELLDDFSRFGHFMDSIGIPYVISFAPDKQSIYPEFLPEYLKKKHGESVFEQLFRDTAGFRLIDLKPTLLASKSISSVPLYFKVDSHWNMHGAYMAYRKIMETVTRSTGIQAIELRATDFSDTTEEIPGLPESSLTQFSRDREKVGSLVPHSDADPVEVHSLEGSLVRIEPKFSPTARFDDMMSRNITRNANGKGKVLVLGDSFTYELSRYFSATFHESMYVNFYANTGKAKDMDLATLLRFFKPDFVLLIKVERSLLGFKERRMRLDQFEGKKSLEFDLSAMAMDQSRMHQIADIKMGESCFSFTATGTDPQIILPIMPDMKYPKFVKVEMTVPKPVTAMMVALDHDNIPSPSVYHEYVKLAAGRNSFIFRTDVTSEKSKLRFDPGDLPLRYIVHRITLIE